MSDMFSLVAQSRAQLGGAHSRRLRRLNDQVPAIVYGGSQAPHPITLEHNKVLKALENEAFYSHILTLNIDGKTERAVLKDIQRHPFKPRIVHMDFLRISADHKIIMHVPLHFKGEDVAPGVKTHGGIVTHLIIDAEVQCLPDNLPEFIEVDLSNLDIDESIHLSELTLPKGVELVALAHGNDLSVATIHLPRAVIEAEPTAETENEATPPTTE